MATVTRRLAALLGASGAGLTDSATASKITTDSINDDAVNSAKIAANAVGTSEVADNVLTATDLAANSVGESELSVDYSAQSVPHIIPGVLYPAVGGKGIDGTTTITSFGTDVAISGFPTLKYYYTDIKGSKPIKDPRIGGHFGSQRHKFKSLQLLEQETSTHGKKVYSVDGREWVRTVGDELSTAYDANGHYTRGQNVTAGSFMEVVGYFLDANFLNEQHTADRNLTVQVNGSSAVAFNDYTATVGSPLNGRYVDEAVLINIDLPTKNSASLGINTLRINFVTGTYPRPAGIELITQDTSNRNNIQIPSQNVVSHGKKFNVSGTPHYDPFSAKTDGSAWTSPTSGTNNANSSASWPTNIDTSTSLGLDKWVDGSNYYRPYNGGRVVKWVDSSGTIKTSVTVMPPNAKSIKSTDINKKAKNAPNDTYLPTFEDETTDINEDQLYELAKDFHWCEFGNGSANGSANHKDASTLGGEADIAFVMDDGLTSLSAVDVNRSLSGNYHRLLPIGDGDYWYLTFIGTGLSYHSDAAHVPLLQNLPYGTHVLQCYRDADFAADFNIDGVAMDDISSPSPNYGLVRDFISFYQPKKPPIPEDACVIADYMLMADYVKKTTDGINYVSKGVRKLHSGRDIFYDTSGAFHSAALHHGSATYEFGTNGVWTSATLAADETKAKLPAFATSIELSGYQDRRQIYIDGSAVADTDNGSGAGAYTIQDTPVALGTYLFEARNKASTNLNLHSMSIVSPIHTSSHYQPFETPFLHELVGGDRNMEQTNLVCSPDGKTWDQITRDTSYIGNGVLFTRDNDTTYTTDTSTIINDDWRGVEHSKSFYNKDSFAIAYDRIICLKEGQYVIHFQTYRGEAGDRDIHLNGAILARAYQNSSGTATMQITTTLERGDYLQTVGRQSTNSYVNFFWIKKA